MTEDKAEKPDYDHEYDFYSDLIIELRELNANVRDLAKEIFDLKTTVAQAQ